MWNPSVKAIWLRAASRLLASMDTPLSDRAACAAERMCSGPCGAQLGRKLIRGGSVGERAVDAQPAMAPIARERRSSMQPSSILGTIVHQITTGPTLAYAILVLTLILAPRIAEFLRLPAMVGLVLAGMALGPHGTRLLDTKQIALSSLGEFGLLYLMFSAGLELDLKLFMKRKQAGLTFALLSFAIPFTLGLVSARLLRYAWAAAVLMGSNWGSHTLVTYPMLRRMGLARNRAVATVVGATTVTDTSALLVLAVVSGSVKPTDR